MTALGSDHGGEQLSSPKILFHRLSFVAHINK